MGATESLIIAGTRSEGATQIVNAAQEPEVRDLIRFLKKCGARITGVGTREIVIEGRPGLSGCEYEVAKDRIEAATYLSLVGACGAQLIIRGAPAEDMTAVIEQGREAGLQIEAEGSELRVRMQGRARALSVETGTHPGFPTDVQPLFVAVLARAEGQSVVVDRIFENRFNYAGDMNRMGAKIKVQGGVAFVEGQERLQGADVEARDLRGGAALVVAGASEEGDSRIFGVHHIERGYERLAEKLRAVGMRAESADGEEPAFV